VITGVSVVAVAAITGFFPGLSYFSGHVAGRCVRVVANLLAGAEPHVCALGAKPNMVWAGSLWLGGDVFWRAVCLASGERAAGSHVGKCDGAVIAFRFGC